MQMSQVHNWEILFQMHIPVRAVEHSILPVEKKRPVFHPEVFYLRH